MKIGSFDLDTDGVYIIAELSANHNGSLEVALETIKAAKEIGANAIKLQTYTADSMTLNVDREEFKAKGLWEGESLYDLYDRAKTPKQWHQKLFDYARSIDIDVFSTPFDKKSVDFLSQFNPSAYKIASFEVTDYDLVRYVASRGKPIIISTGIAYEEELEDIVRICKEVKNDQIVLLKCTSAYPTPFEDANLRTISDMAKKYNVTVGFSDHTLGAIAPTVAVSLGAKVIEKHFILDKSIDSPDIEFSLDKKEFSAMIKAVRTTEKLLGKIDYTMDEKKLKNRSFCRSLYISKEIDRGELFSEDNIRSVRPGYGLHPKHLDELIGKEAKKSYSVGDRLTKKDLE